MTPYTSTTLEEIAGHSPLITGNNSSTTIRINTIDSIHPSALIQSSQTTPIGCIVILAPQRTMDTWWNDITRFCLLMRVVRSIDQHLNAHYGPYPIFIIHAKDWNLDPKQRDGPYTDSDKALIRSWVNHSKVIFKAIDLYSNNALEPNTTVDLILKWREGYDDSVSGRDLGYTSMCRLWSGRLQQMEELSPYKYYMRLDDDSLFIQKLSEDPFIKMETNQLQYVWRRDASDHWGIAQLWGICKKYITLTAETPFMNGASYYTGSQPYNNFHISTVAFWKSPTWMAIWNELNEQHAFYKYRVGDANVHAMAVMLMEKGQYQKWKELPYRHNTNDMYSEWAPVEWRYECERAEVAHNASWTAQRGS